jgi:1-phosphatidylinositol-3-phosphate 5-kinase
MYKQKGQVRVCNFCYAEQQHKEEEENISLPYKQEISYPLSKKQTTDSYSPIIPSQKPPRAVPKMQIPTTAFKQTRSTYGSEDTTTFALEIPAHSNSYQSSSPLAANDVQIPILANCSQNDRPPNALDSYSTVNHLPAITATSTEGGFKRLLDAGTSLLKSRPRSNTSNSAPLEDTRHSVTPYESPAPFRGGMYSPNHSGYLDKGGGTVVTESDLSGYQGNNVEADMNGDLEYQPYERPPNLVGLNSSVRMSSNSSHRSADELIEEVMGSDDDSYENRLRIKWSDERKGRERTISFPRRKSLNNGSPRMRSIRINTSGLPKSDFGQEGRSPHLSPYIGDDKFSFGQDITKSSRFRPPRQRRISGPPQTVELSITALSHARKMLRQLMEEINLSDSNTSKEDWEDVIMNILLKVTNNVQPDVRSGDDMDVRHYVKIKKIPGGLPSDSFYVKGVVCTKNMVHKRMVKNISHPRILILLFSLDYSRVEMENQLLSIAPVISQEREHISKLVGRIVALKPSLLLVKSNVSRLALEFLLAANIPVIHNVKHSVIEAIARCTQATVVTSVDKLQQGVSFGRCGSFEVRTIIHEWLPNRRKTFLIFDDCAPELGGTIVLRGAKDDTLSVIKRLIDFMVFVVNNLKLETSILRDSFAKNRGSLEEAEEHPTDVDEDGMNVSGHHLMDLIKLYQTTILSVSQYVVFPSPYLLLTLKEVEDKLMLLQQNHCKSISSVKDVPLSASPTRSTFERQSISSEVPSHSTEEGIDAEYDLMAKHHQITRAWDAYIGENPESISPFFHQNIVVLYSSVCTVTTVPCRGPEIRIFSFYRFPSDKTLGQYIMDLCVDAHQPCTSMMCDHPMLQHYRSYAHGDARINVMIESFDCPLPGMSDKLLMWSYCRECNKPTPVLPMSENTWNYSFGKFLEIFLYQKGVHCRADICPHDMVRHHVRYFGYMNLAVRFQYDSIELLEVSPPPMRLFILSKVQMDLKEEELRTLRQKINKFYQSIAERNKSFPFDLVDPRKLETCKVELQEMSLEAQGEKKDALQLVQNIYANSDQNDTLSMTWVRRRLFQLVERWDAVYSDFVRYYLQPERELKKLTASHLRKMFPADFSDGVILSLDNERIKRATEVGDLPLLGVSLDGETNDTLIDRADKKGKDISSSPAALPILSVSPSDKSLNDLALSSDTTCSSCKENKLTFLRPEVRRRFSLDLMNELNEKLKSEENNDSSSSNRRNLTKFMRVKGSATPPAAYTPSRIPVPLISNQKGPGTPMCDLYRPPHLSTSESPRNTIKNESKILSPQPGYRRHRRHNSIGHTQDLGQSIFDEIKNSINRSELSSSYLGHGSGSRDNRFRSKLPRKKTYMQVYTRANELVQEDMEDEFHPYHSPESKKKNKRHHIPIQKSKNHRHLSYPDRMLPFYDDGEDADCDSNNEGQDDSEPEVDYFSPMAPFARNVIETNTVPLEVSIDSNPESSQGSFSRPYFPFSDGQQDMSGEDDTDRDLPCASDLLKAQQLDDMSISDLHNIHPDMISSNPNTMSINLSLSDTLYESRHSPEKSSFMKTLTNFLPDSGVRNLLPLELPL